MKREKVAFLHDILIIILNHLMVTATAITVMGFAQRSDSMIGFWLATVILPMLLYVLQYWIEQSTIFYGIHGAFLVAGFFLPLNLLVKVIVLVILTFYLGMSIFWKTKSVTGRPTLLHPLAFAVLLVVLAALYDREGNGLWGHYYVLIAVAYFSGYFCCHYMKKYLHFLVVRMANITNFPEKAIFAAGMKQALALSVGGFLITVVTIYNQWFSHLGEWLLSLLPNRTESGGQMMQGPLFEPQGSMPSIEQMFGPIEVHTVPVWVQVMITIIKIVVIVAVCALVIYYFYSTFRRVFLFLKNNFSGAEKVEEAQMGVSGDIRERCETKVERKKEREHKFFLNRREKVRKIYKTKMLKSKDQIVGDLAKEHLGYLTAKECCEKVKAETLQEVYEKARYSDKEVTAQDVAMVK